MSSATLSNPDRLLAPIGGSNPAGTDLRYSTTYDRIKKARKATEERPEDNSLWREVAAFTAEALATQSKDLQLAVWLLDATARVDGFDGVATTLTVIRRLVDDYWDTLYPPIDPDDDEPLGSRVGLFDWLNDKLAAQLKELPLSDGPKGYGLLHYETTQISDAVKKKALLEAGWPSLDKFDADMTAASTEFLEATKQGVQDALAALTALGESSERAFRVVEAQFGRAEIGFGVSQRTLEACSGQLDRALQRRPRTSQPPATTAVTSPATGQNQQPAVTAPPPVQPAPVAAVSFAAAPGSRDSALNQLRVLVQFLREDNARSPLPYLLARAIGFGTLYAWESLDGKALAGPTTTATRQKLKALFTEEKWRELLEESEREVCAVEKQGWLDLQRYSIIALDKLGDYKEAAAAARSAVRALLARHGDLPTRDLEDDTPAASRDTRDWLQTEFGSARPASAAPPTAAEPTPAAPPVRETKDDADLWNAAVNLVKTSKAAQGIALLQSRADGAGSGREQFLHRLQLAELCQMAGNHALGYPIADDLARLCDQNRLEQWEERPLLVRVWSVLYRCGLQVQSADQTTQGRVKEAFARLCRLDPTQAMALEREKAPSGWFGR